MCITGNQTFIHIDPKEATYIILSARPYKGRLYDYFDPGHA